MKKRIIGWLLSVMLVLQSFGATQVFANETSSMLNNCKTTEETVAVSKQIVVNGVKFELTTNGTATLVDGSQVTGKYKIPKSVTHKGKSYNVTEISGIAFFNNTALTEIVMPSTIKTIADGEYDNDTGMYTGAFAYCTALKKVTFSNNLEYIGVRAFSQCAVLNNVTLPNKVETIKEEDSETYNS